VKVIYIVGLGRSGSTLLDLQLDAHSAIRSLGGVRRMQGALDGICACGAANLRACAFWQGVEAALERTLGKGLDGLELDATNETAFSRDNTALFHAAADVAGVDWVVDSSKSVSRLKRLLEATDLEVVPIHIDRHPCGYTYSQRKRKRVSLTPAFSYVGCSLRTLALLRDRPHAMIEYARLARDNEACLRELMHWLGLPLEYDQMDWAEQEHHNVGGGAVLKKTSGSIVSFDDQWREALPTHTQALIRAIAMPGLLANDAKARRWGFR